MKLRFASIEGDDGAQESRGQHFWRLHEEYDAEQVELHKATLAEEHQCDRTVGDPVGEASASSSSTLRIEDSPPPIRGPSEGELPRLILHPDGWGDRVLKRPSGA